MATYKSAQVASTVEPKTAVQGLISKTGSYAVTSTENSTGNIIEMVKVPIGATVLDVIFYSPDLEIGGPTLSLGVGDGDSTSYYIATETTVGRAAGSTRGNVFVPKKYAKDDTIDVIFTAGSTTHQNGTIYLTVEYTMDP